MRQNYCILTTDGSTEFWSPISRTIFWQEDEWAKMSNTVWMPKECCLAIDNCYFEGLTEEKDAQLRTLFSTKQIVQKFSVSGLYQSLRTRLDDVFAMITTKEISKKFLNFLFKHQTEIFKMVRLIVYLRKLRFYVKIVKSYLLSRIMEERSIFRTQMHLVSTINHGLIVQP